MIGGEGEGGKGVKEEAALRAMKTTEVYTLDTHHAQGGCGGGGGGGGGGGVCVV